MKDFILVIALSFLIGMPVGFANEADSCSVVLCMWGRLQGEDGGSDCSSFEDKYFGIQIFKRGSFKKSATSKARFKLLDGCSSATQEDKKSINNTFGTMLFG